MAINNASDANRRLDQLLMESGTPLVHYKSVFWKCVNAGADLMTHYRGTRILNALLVSNHNGVNNDAIERLFELNAGLANVVDAENLTPLQRLVADLNSGKCIFNDFKENVELLANHGAHLDVICPGAFKGTVMHLLARTNNKGVNNPTINALIAMNKEFLNMKDVYGRTPLQSYIRNQPEVTAVEINGWKSAGSILDTKDKNGETPLHSACLSGNLDVAKKLVEEGLDFLATTNSLDTMLHCAVFHTDVKLWQWLLDKGVDVNAKNIYEKTALHLAIDIKNIAMIRWLQEHGALLANTDSEYKKAMELVLKQNGPTVCPHSLESQRERALFDKKQQLFSFIEDMRQYGEKLKGDGSTKGGIVVELATKLSAMTTTFFTDNNNALSAFPQFKKDFTAVLSSKNKEMSEYRVCWSTICANIAVALTGIGAILLVGQLIYSKVTQGRALSFFQANKTTSEAKVSALDHAMQEMSLFEMKANPVG